MNILYLCADRGIPVRGHKGAAVHVRAMCDAFAEAGHQVTLLTPRFGVEEGPMPRAELIKVPLPPCGKHNLDEAVRRDRQSQAYNAVLYAAALEIMNEREIDVIYERYSLWSDVGARLSRETGRPFVLEVNAPLCEEAARYRTLSDLGLARQVEATQFQAAHSIAVVSDALRTYVVQRGADAKKVEAVPNGVNPQHFHPAVRGGEIHHRYGLHDRLIVGFVGRARPWHDLDTLLRAMSQLYAEDKRYHLLLVGQMSKTVSEKLAHYGLQDAATLTGAIPHHEVPEHIAAMDVAVSSHLALDDFYFSPLKLYEYLACGVPTVAANIGQPAKVIEDGVTGYLYEPGCPNSLADSVRRIINDPTEARQVAWQGAVRVLSEHTWQQNAQTVIKQLQRHAHMPDKKHLSDQHEGQSDHSVVKYTPTSSQQANMTLPLIDHKLRQRLYRATRPDLALPLLLLHHDVPILRKKRKNVKEINKIEILKYKPGRRCVLGYDLRGQRKGKSIQQRVIGKVFRDERGLRLHHLQQRLWSNGFGAHAADGIHVPRSLGYVPKMRMQVQEYAPGETVDALLKKGPIIHLMPRVAQGIAKLHNKPPAELTAGAEGTVKSLNEKSNSAAKAPTPGPSPNARGGESFLSFGVRGRAGRHARGGRFRKGRVFPICIKPYLLSDELEHLARFTNKLALLRPQSIKQVTDLQDRLIAWAKQLPELPMRRPIHRDFYYSQLLFDKEQERLTLIDLDLLTLGDPALDVANFSAHLTFMAMEMLGNRYALIKENHLFLARYADYRLVDTAFWQRFAFYRASTFFRLMQVVASREHMGHLFDVLYKQTLDCVERA